MTSPAGGPPPPPPTKPAGYITDSNWNNCIKKIAGAERSTGVSMTALTYNTGNGYHFSLQPQWADPKQKSIVQPHITIDQTDIHYYHPGYPLSVSAQTQNNLAPQRFVGDYAIDYDGLIRNFCAEAEDKKARFNASRKYDQDAAQYRKTYSWQSIVDMWAAEQRNAGNYLVVQISDGDTLIIINQGPDPRPCAVKKSNLSAIKEPDNVANYTMTYLQDNYCVVSGSDVSGYISKTLLEAGRVKSWGKNSPEQRLLKKSAWAREIQEKSSASITAKISGGKISGSEDATVIVFPAGDVLKRAMKAATGAPGRSVQDRTAFEAYVHDLVNDEMRTWSPRDEPDEVMFQQKAEEVVGKAARRAYFVDTGTAVWVIPQELSKDAEPEDRKLGVPRYKAVAPYKPGGVDSGRIILTSGSVYYHIPKGFRRVRLGAGDPADAGIVLVSTAGGEDAAALKRPPDGPDGLIAFDYLRYQWLNGLPDAVLTPCGAVTLIRLPGPECIVIADDASQYAAGGACFVVTGTSGAQRFKHPRTGELLAVDAATSPRVTIVSPVCTLASGSYVLADAKGDYLVCPPAAAPGTLAIEAGGTIVGFSDMASATKLTVQTFINEGYFPAKVPVAFDSGSKYFVCQDPASGTITCYAHALYATELTAINPTAAAILQEIVAGGQTLVAVDGTGDYAGWELIVRPSGVMPLNPARILRQLKGGECLVTYSTGTPSWADCVCVKVFGSFAGNSCDLVLTGTDGSFAGYASSATATDAWQVVVSGAPAYPAGGTHCCLQAYPLVGEEPQENGFGWFDLIKPPGADAEGEFTGTVVQAGPTVQEFLTGPAGGGEWYAVSSEDTGALTLCAPMSPAQEVLVLPDGETLDSMHGSQSDSEDDDESSDDDYESSDDDYELSDRDEQAIAWHGKIDPLRRL